MICMLVEYEIFAVIRELISSSIAESIARSSLDVGHVLIFKTRLPHLGSVTLCVQLTLSFDDLS